MFYSRELLARKASLGQIWLLGTRQAKLDRRKANKLDIARLCEEILNPPVPMALRLSSILMGGVVILYERKVMFLHDDANRFLVEIRNAWKVMEERTLLPKGKAKAKRKSITLPENEETSMGFTNAGEPEEEISMGFKQNLLNMQLDQVDDYYITSDPMEDNLANDHHQADDNDITLTDLFQPNTNIRGRFERFEDGDEGTQVNFTLDEHIEIPPTPIPSPARHVEPQRAGGSQEQYRENDLGQQFKRKKEARDQQRQGPGKHKTRKPKGIITDEEQTVISNHVYHSWLHDTSDIVSRTRRKKRGPKSVLSALKMAKLMELPSIVLMDDMFVKGNQEIPYPEPLLDLWKKSNRPQDDSPSVRTSPVQPHPQPHEPSSTERVHSDYPMDYPFEDLHSGVGSPSHVAAVELPRSKGTKATPVKINHFVLSGNSGDAVRSTGSSVSGDGVPSGNLEVQIDRVGSKKKNVPSTSRNNSGLDTVHEAFCEADTEYKLTREGRKNSAPDPDFMVVTQLTMETPANDTPPDIMTENIKTHMKTHFETPGAPRVESLQNLAAGLTRKGAAQLFYQTCVLASQGFLKVRQEVPFGDVSISKGAKM
ncbi:DETERMINATE, INFERTILE 1, SYNAPTIC 1 [Hibiscus trionum]|uniref:DETERMINATE, INFERTILE 1, SYNAPTIC 1 n=2 Tax=Hibiscus trionum TaxID=183268 RepID=A0A9W7LW44_HIBTR|nr:DETERMINATE, INFERTILE 1, SYNAPTIC 1 [Hibiscus trionum]